MTFPATRCVTGSIPTLRALEVYLDFGPMQPWFRLINRLGANPVYLSGIQSAVSGFRTIAPGGWTCEFGGGGRKGISVGDDVGDGPGSGGAGRVCGSGVFVRIYLCS